MKKEGTTSIVTIKDGKAVKRIKLNEMHNLESALCELYFMNLLNNKYFIKADKVSYKNMTLKITMKEYRCLSDVLKNKEKINVNKIVAGLIEGLCYLHWNGIYYGDIKTDNVVIDENDNPIYIDLGSLTTCEKYVGLDSQIYRPDNPSSIEYNDVYQLGIIILDVITGGKVEEIVDDENVQDSLEKQRLEIFSRCEKLMKDYNDLNYMDIVKMMITKENKMVIYPIAQKIGMEMIVKRIKFPTSNINKKFKEYKINDRAKELASVMHEKYEYNLSLFLGCVIHDRGKSDKYFNDSEMDNRIDYLIDMIN